jgi:hypothetical protein
MPAAYLLTKMPATYLLTKMPAAYLLTKMPASYLLTKMPATYRLTKLPKINGTRSMVQISLSINGPDPLSHFAISRIATSRRGLTTSSMLRTPDCRVPKIFSRQINGTRSTVQISSSTNGPDPLSHFAISRFATSRLGETTPSMLRTPETRIPKFSRVRSMGPDLRLRSPLAPMVQIHSCISRFHVSRLRDLGRQLPPCSELPKPEFPKISRVRSMGPDRRFRSPRASTVQILSHFSRLHEFGKQQPPCS